MTITAIDINTYQLAHPSKEAIKVASTWIELPRFGGECLLKTYAQVAGYPTPELVDSSTIKGIGYNYHYDFDTTDMDAGVYTARCVAVNGSRTSIDEVEFEIQ